MPSNKPAKVIHLLDQSRGPRNHGRFPIVCGGYAPHRYVTALAFKVTCQHCNPPGRRKVRVTPRSPADLVGA